MSAACSNACAPSPTPSFESLSLPTQGMIERRGDGRREEGQKKTRRKIKKENEKEKKKKRKKKKTGHVKQVPRARVSVSRCISKHTSPRSKSYILYSCAVWWGICAIVLAHEFKIYIHKIKRLGRMPCTQSPMGSRVTQPAWLLRCFQRVYAQVLVEPKVSEGQVVATCKFLRSHSTLPNASSLFS